MTPQQIVGLAARLFAIWLAINSVQAFEMAAAMHRQPGAESTPAPYIIAALLMLAAVLLWLFPMAVGHKLVPRTHSKDVIHVPANEIVVIACVVLGLWVLVVRAIPALAYYIAVVAMWIKNAQPITSLDQSYHLSFVLGLVQLAVGLVLVLRARRISAYLLPEYPNDEAR